MWGTPDRRWRLWKETKSWRKNQALPGAQQGGMGMTVLRNFWSPTVGSVQALACSAAANWTLPVVYLSGQLLDTLLCSAFFYHVGSSFERIIKEHHVGSPVFPSCGRRLETRKRSKAFMCALIDNSLLKEIPDRLG